MSRVIPAILAHSKEEFRDKVSRVRDLDAMVHIDVMDGEFVDNVTWADPEKIPGIMQSLPFEVHLMVMNPQEHVKKWFDSGAIRVFFHIEAVKDPDIVISAAEDNAERLGVAINPDTVLSALDTALHSLHNVLAMGVYPGRSGQEFLERALDNIKYVRRHNPDVVITVDGGVKPKNAARIRSAGANDIVMGSAITDATNPKEVYEKIQTLHYK